MKYFIVIKENINDNIIDNKLSSEKFKLSDCIRLFKPKKLTAANVGKDSRKDILADSTLLKCNKRPAVIVIPDLLTPGIKDNI